MLVGLLNGSFSFIIEVTFARLNQQCSPSSSLDQILFVQYMRMTYLIIYQSSTLQMFICSSPQLQNVLWIRNCTAYRETMTSHSLGELAGSRRTLQQQEAGGRHDSHLESMTSCQ